MPIDRADTLLDLLAESQLLTPTQVEECRGTLSSFPDTKALARHLLQRDWLTAYQVNQVLQGKAGDLVLDTYVLLERVGQGGMGQVFKARHSVMNRVVALKIIRPERLANPELVRRFRREIQMTAHLAHPNIVIAHDAKQVGDTHFLVMEYVEGTDLARLVEKNGPRPVTQACDFVRQAALGLQHAHERGLVHRDIKPANLLLDVKENTVKVLDMGLARLSQAADADLTAAGLTQEGTVMGTPDYMAPEQAENTATVDTRADIYSLGCTLYFLLTGSAPFPKGTLAQKLRKHAQAEPAPLGSFRGDVPAGLVAVLRRMMAKDPEQRYQTPGAAAAALEPFCRTGPVTAIPVGAAARPVAVPLSEETVALMPPPVAVPVAVPAAETVPPSMLDSVAEATPRKPSPTAQVKEAWRRLGRRGQLAAAAGAAVVLLVLVIVLWPRRHTPPPPPPEPEPVGLFQLDPKKVPQVERRHWHPKEFDNMLVAVLGEHRARVASPACLVMRPDGKKLAFSGPNAILVDAETLHRDNDEKGLTEKGGAEYAGWVNCLAFSADNRLLVTGSNDKTVRLWDGDTGQAVATFDGMHDGPVYAVAITRDGRRVLSAGEDKVVRVWDVTTRKQVAAYTGHTTPVRAVAVTPDGKHAFSAGGTNAAGELADRDVQMWPLEAASSEEARRFKGHDGVIAHLAVSPDGKRLLAVGNSSNAWLWDLAVPEKPVALAAEDRANQSAAAAFLPDGRVATRTSTGVFKVWENPKASDAPPRALFTGPELPAGPTLVACYPDSRRVALVVGTTVRVWDVEKKEEWHAPVGAQAPVTHLALGGGRWLLTAGQDFRMRLWDLETARQMGEAFGEIPTNQTFSGVAVSADGLNAFAATATDTVRLWETRTGRNVRTFTSPKNPRLGPVALSPDGKRLLSADKGLVLWDTAAPDPEPMRRFGGHANAVLQLGFLADDTHPRRAFSFDGAELLVWQDVGRDEEVRRLAIAGSVVAVARDADPVYVGDGGGHVMHWHDLTGGKPRKWPFEDLHTQGITAMALAPDGKTLATAGYDRRLIVWDLTESRPKGKEWQPMVGGVTALLFAPDSRHLIVATGNTTVYVLRLPAK